MHAYLAYSGIYNPGATKLTYMTPARWAFLIWCVLAGSINRALSHSFRRPAIHFILLGTLLYQFSENGHRIVVKGISWRFFVLMVANALYLYLWYSHLYGWGKCCQFRSHP